MLASKCLFYPLPIALRLRTKVNCALACAILVLVWNGIAFPEIAWAQPQQLQSIPEGSSSRESRENAQRLIPYSQLTGQATTKIRNVVEHSCYFRRMPTQVLECDGEMFLFLVRHPEVIVNIWDVMGITKVRLDRTSQYQLSGDDGAGTKCNLDLVFGNDTTHIYYVDGGYTGNLWPRELAGDSVAILHHSTRTDSAGLSWVTVSMDVFLKLENRGADLVVRTLGPLVNKSADYNFVECAAFVSQVSQVAKRNPPGIETLANKLQNLRPEVRNEFISTARRVPARSGRVAQVAKPTTTPSGYSVEEIVPGSETPRSELEGLMTNTRVPVATPSPTVPTANPAGRPTSTRKSDPNRVESDTPSVSSESDSPTLQKIFREQR
jgi:hypothetical protein